MFIAQELRKKSIAEYLLYMWQVEDIIRAYDCSLSRLRREYIARFDYDDEQIEEMTDWYGNLVTPIGSSANQSGGASTDVGATRPTACEHEVPLLYVAIL